VVSAPEAHKALWVSSAAWEEEEEKQYMSSFWELEFALWASLPVESAPFCLLFQVGVCFLCPWPLNYTSDSWDDRCTSPQTGSLLEIGSR
jgi:hypothetical protein